MFSYRPHFVPNKIILIGAGGTGSRLMPVMTQLVKSCLRRHNPQAHIENLSIFVIDGDTVEEKNLVRQNFIARDVGRNKAAVVAERYGNAFDVPVYAGTEFITPSTVPAQLFPQYTGVAGENFSYEYSVVIFAVDSAQARRDILRNISRTTAEGCPIFFIDAGNEDAFGQVKWFTNHVVRTGSSGKRLDPAIQAGSLSSFPDLRPEVKEVMYIPYDPAYYQQLGSSAAEISCAELPQTLAINNMMATMIGCVLQNFLLMKSMTYDGMRFHMNGALSTDVNTLERWAQRTLSSDFPLYFQRVYLQDDLQAYRDALKATFKTLNLTLQDDGSLTPIAVTPPAAPPLTTTTSSGGAVKRVRRKPVPQEEEANSERAPLTAGEGLVILPAEIPPLTPLPTPEEPAPAF